MPTVRSASTCSFPSPGETPAPTATYDILVVVSDHAPAERRRSRLAYEVLWGTGVAADVLVSTASQFEGRAHLAASLPATVIREGKLLHAHDPALLAEVRAWLTKAGQGPGCAIPAIRLNFHRCARLPEREATMSSSRFLILCLVSALAAFSGAFVSMRLASPAQAAAQSQPSTAPVVRVQRLELVDKTGRLRGALSVNDKGGAGLGLFTSAGEEMLYRCR